MTQPAFVGRRSQFDALEQAWEGVVDGARQVVFVGAEAGGGKTRFVVEAALALHAEGAGIVWGACSQDMGLAHDPFVEPVATLLGALVPDAEQPALSEATLDRLRTLGVSSPSPSVVMPSQRRPAWAAHCGVRFHSSCA
jgi:predicted ATPase